MKIENYLTAAKVPEALWPDALKSFALAKERSKQVSKFKRRAMFVMAWVTARLPWDAEHLPSEYAAYDNDVSINGDPWPWKQLDTGEWVRFAPLEDTPEARAQCYWAKGSHPRSRWARYIWLGWRNRASKLAYDLGAPKSDDVEWFGTPDVSKSKEGVCVWRMGDSWQIMSVAKVGPFAIRRNIGFKINNVVQNQHIVANVTWIPFSFPLWQG